jgi:DNA polymerase-3 subunit delta
MTSIEYKGWIRRKFEINGISIGNEAIETFYQRAGNNLENADNETNKLISYASSTKEVSVDDVLNLVIKEMDTNVFSLSNAIIAKDKEKALNVYNNLLLAGEDPVGLLSLSSRALRESYLVQLLLQKKYSQSDIAREMRVSNGKAYYLIKNAKSIVKENVEYFIHRFAELDYKIKKGLIDSKTGLEFLLFEI